MAVDNLQILDIIEVMEAFLERKRPPEHIRPSLDVGYKIEQQSIFIHQIRPVWNDAAKIIYPEVAKATFVKTKNHWKVFWLRSNLKWYAYDPKPTVKTLKEFVKLVEEDRHALFWG
ncbi:DUF3024 domain-containing protein [Chryseolinea lacunae]|uniref:DUF3024 domain-containing protein n=1 Tax=Chryseolinea lacunae TaxID=2801331 RepID=A0ABS1KMN6_9BACT|nr:DUF3024 domain-containing protein [Chryseolinea lacunae]MBL0740729.1 DUF3024 domain-containing protein [Chryseolinea lacunae]